jgi:hypothetical protein
MPPNPPPDRPGAGNPVLTAVLVLCILGLLGTMGMAVMFSQLSGQMHGGGRFSAGAALANVALFGLLPLLVLCFAHLRGPTASVQGFVILLSLVLPFPHWALFMGAVMMAPGLPEDAFHGAAAGLMLVESAACLWMSSRAWAKHRAAP